jgi:hypothetical protein
MAIASWSTRRILMLWVGGLLVQWLLLVSPVLLARHLIGNRAQFLRAAAQQDTRWRAGELADSLSLAKQRADARATQNYSITPQGDTFFPLVHERSGRPDPAVTAVRVQQTERNARFVTAVLVGLVPTILILVTIIWLVARRE